VRGDRSLQVRHPVAAPLYSKFTPCRGMNHG
jgi:hypothetical protein